MKIEHFAYNVADPVAVADWYTAHLGLRIVRIVDGPAKTHFLADDQATAIEIYCNPPDQIPDYASMDPLQLHIAFVSDDPTTDATRLIATGATLCSNTPFPDGTHLIMLRDPWGLALQLCKRTTPLLG
jgi:glyoxylase I family protein